MTTLIDSAGRVRFAADQTVMQGPLMTYDKEMSVKVVCTSLMWLSATCVSSALYDTAGFVASVRIS
jgi:hypothetical protein